jgi:pSer/pThr/pTyr-binding forkhead associated (FHA) protein
MRSTNGTYLNGNPLTQPQPLAEGDDVVVAITLKHPEGAKRFKFTLKG